MRAELLTLVRKGEVPASRRSLPEVMRALFSVEVEADDRLLRDLSCAMARYEEPPTFKSEVSTALEKVRGAVETQWDDARVWLEDLAVRWQERLDPWSIRLRLALALVGVFIVTTVGSVALYAKGTHVEEGASPAPERQGSPKRSTFVEVEPPARSEPATTVSVRRGLAPTTRPTPVVTRPPSNTEDDEIDDGTIMVATRTASARTPGPRTVSRARREPPRRVAKSSPKAPSSEEKVRQSFGSLRVESDPPLEIRLGGQSRRGAFELTEARGTIYLGAGLDPVRDPLRVSIGYSIDSGEIRYTLQSVPFAIVQNSYGAGLGKTPVAGLKGERDTTFVLRSPNDGRRVEVRLVHGG